MSATEKNPTAQQRNASRPIYAATVSQLAISKDGTNPVRIERNSNFELTLDQFTPPGLSLPRGAARRLES